MRSAAWVFFVLAIGFPAWVLRSVYQEGAAAVAKGEQLCGMPLLFAYLLCLVALVFGGGLAAVLAWMDYRDQPTPGGLSRKLEVGFLSLPVITGIGLIAFIVLWFLLHSR